MYAEARDLLIKASQLHDQGYLAEAKTLYNQVLTLDPNTFEAKRLLGVIYRQMGDPTAAIACLEHILREHPKLPDDKKALVWTHLSTAYFDLRRHKSVVDTARQATQLDPKLANAWNNLGASLKALGKAEEAAKAFEKALEINPGYARAMNNLAEAYQEAGHPEQAEAMYRRLLDTHPDHPGAVQGLSPVLRSLGRQDEARHLLEKSLEKHPDNLDLIRTLAGFSDWKMMPQHREQLLERVNTPGFDPGRKETLLFLLAADAQKNKDMAQMGNWYRQANAHKAARVTYNFLSHDRFYEKMTTLFDQAFARQIRAFWPEPKGMADPEWQPVFVVGLPRSGTTLMNQVLASHPDITSIGELSTGFSRALDTLPRWQSFVKDEIPPEEFGPYLLSNQARYQLSSEYRKNQAAAGASGSTVVDKLPGNFMYLPFIGLAMPRARIILTRRNLRDVALSCYMQNFAHGQGFSFAWDRIMHFFTIYRKLTGLYKELFGDRFMTVSYEDLVTDFESQARNLVAFAGHPWSDNCLTFHTADSAVRTASMEQVRMPLYTDSIGRWEQYVDIFPELAEIPEY